MSDARENKLERAVQVRRQLASLKGKAVDAVTVYLAALNGQVRDVTTHLNRTEIPGLGAADAILVEHHKATKAAMQCAADLNVVTVDIQRNRMVLVRLATELEVPVADLERLDVDELFERYGDVAT